MPLQTAFATARQQLQGTGLFKEVLFTPVDRDSLVELWTEGRKRFEAKIADCRLQPFKTIADIGESYVAIVPALSLVNGLLLDPNTQQIRRSVFDQNVRAFLGLENETNSQIRESIHSVTKSARFALLNNGITIVSRDIRVQGESVVLESPQIVNGCQTCSVLFAERLALTPQVFVVCKLIETDNQDIFTEIIEATNSQTGIRKDQLLAATPGVQAVAKYFDSLADDTDARPKLYFERRTNQHADAGCGKGRIFDIGRLARAYSAFFLDQPHVAARYPTQMIRQVGDKIFSEDADPVLFYIAALALYRAENALGNSYISRDLQAAKWHLLMMMKYQNAPTAQKSGFVPSKAREALLDALAISGKASAAKFRIGAERLRKTEWNRDTLRSEKFTESLRKAILSSKPKRAKKKQAKTGQPANV